MTNPTYKLLKDVKSLYGSDGWIERDGQVIDADDLVHELATALEFALEGLYGVYVNIGEDTDGARNAEELFGPWVGFDPATHIPKLVADFRRESEEDYERDLETAYDNGFENGVYYHENTSYAPLNPYRNRKAES